MAQADLAGLPGLGAKRLAALREKGMEDGWDLLMRLPQGYMDTTSPVGIGDLREGQSCAIRGYLSGGPSLHRVGGRQWVRAKLSDETGSVELLWFSAPWIRQQLQMGEEYLLYGQVTRKKQGLLMIQPSIHIQAGILAQYMAVPGVPAKTYRKWVQLMLDRLLPGCGETLPQSLLDRMELMPRAQALQTAHCPEDLEALRAARYRFSFEELLLYQAALRAAARNLPQGVRMRVPKKAADAFWAALPFAPTGAQRRVLEEILADLGKETAMARMVQGDVGCGKTAIAFGAMAASAACGYQSALMAPTEVLAQQHLQTAQRILEPMGIRCGLLTGKMGAAAQRGAHEAVRRGEWQVVIGTHALISQGVEYQNLGLVITDEQHRFGVRQRTLLSEKGTQPNVLVLSATPIPRSLALVLFGDLSISVVDELPPGRKPVKTHIVPEQKRGDMLAFLRAQVAAGAQVYFVCPLVEDSEALDEVASAQSLHERLAREELPGLRIGCVHGRMRGEEKETVLSAFRQGTLDVLVSTTVIEVGVDVPNASVMVIEDAFRFGLSQLHQLRGRVGRGQRESYCFLLSAPNERLRTLVQCHDGFEIAKKDLEIRGAGDFFGTRQHGQFLQDHLLQGSDAALVARTQQLIEAYLSDPSLRTEAEQVFASAQVMMRNRERKLARN